MIDYLYYKLYQASLKSSLNDIPAFLASIFLGGLISVNVLVISAFLTKIDVLPFLFSDSRQASFFCFCLIILLMFIYRKKRYRKIIKKYSKEDEKQRIRGNIAVAVYVAISFLSIFAVAFFKPGKI